ncbi:MAG: hypothetical protein LBB54_02280, partial [Cellulomonadaceae bacterium]|nr:hypothetical protein [Cellulomonadaceae bacterium]
MFEAINTSAARRFILAAAAIATTLGIATPAAAAVETSAVSTVATVATVARQVETDEFAGHLPAYAAAANRTADQAAQTAQADEEAARIAETAAAAATADAAQNASTESAASDVLSYVIANSGGQEAVDACTGGLTSMDSVASWIGK